MDEWDFEEDFSAADEDGPPLVMERFRRFGWLVMVLVPLLAVTLTQTSISRSWALIIFVGTMVALSALRDRD